MSRFSPKTLAIVGAAILVVPSVVLPQDRHADLDASLGFGRPKIAAVPPPAINQAALDTARGEADRVAAELKAAQETMAGMKARLADVEAERDEARVAILRKAASKDPRVAPVPCRYRMIDASGQQWEHADENQLREFVESKNAQIQQRR